MKANKFLVSIYFILLLSLTGCEKIPTNANTAFRNYTLGLFREDVSSNALGLHYTLEHPETYGITNVPKTFGSFPTSPAASLVFFENCEAALNKFSYQTLSTENQLTYDILSYYISIEKTGAAYHLYAEPLSPITGIHAQLPILLSEYHLHSEADVITYLELLKATPDYFQSLIAFEQSKAANGLFMSDAVLSDVLEQCHAFLKMGDQNYLFSSFVERLSSLPELSPENRMTYISSHEALVKNYVYPAYQSLITALETLKGSGKNNMGLCHFPEGKSYVSYLVASETASSRTIPEIKTLMETHIAEDLLTLMSLDKNFSFDVSYDSPIEILKDLRKKTARTFPDCASVSVEIKYVPKALEDYLSPAFYFIPAIDNKEENVIYINQAHSMENLQLFSTLAHEGYPGHMYQTTYFSAKNPDPVRHLFSFKGYVEGWATYAEMCSYYISPLDKTSAIAAQKNNSLLLGLYAMADLGIHYEGWTLDDTVQFFEKYGIKNLSTIKEIYNYILGDPCNYLAYYVGYLEIMELKRESGLSHREFHEKFLDIGPAPFSIVRKHLLDQ